MKKFHPSEIACYDLENLKLDKLITKHVSETQTSCLVMKREPCITGTIVYRVYIASPIDNCRLLIKQFRDLTDFSLWLCTNETYKSFVCLNYTHLS